jgi:hypothetical protein
MTGYPTSEPPKGLRAGLYGLAAFWTFFITVLLGNVIFDATGGTPSQINYCMFVAVVSWLVLTIGLFGSCAESNLSTVCIVADSFAVLFTFIAAVVLSAKLGVHSCSNYVRPSLFLFPFPFPPLNNLLPNLSQPF